MKPAIAVVVVTHNSAAEVATCLRALRQYAWPQEGLGPVEEVVVVDNASSDATCEIIAAKEPRVQLVRNLDNAGFAAAVNQGVRLTASPLVLLLNPDAALMTGLEGLTNALASAEVGVAGGRLIGHDGVWQRGFNVRSFPTPAALACEILLLNRIWPGNPVNRRYRCLDLDPQRQQDVDQPAGAFLMFRREVWVELGGFDERFRPLWFEDVDFCLRVKRAGYRNVYVASAVTRHTGAHSIELSSVQFRQRAWYRSLLRYCYKHFPRNIQRRLRLACVLGLWVRWAACWFGLGDRKERKAYASALKQVLESRGTAGPDTILGRTSIVEF